MSKKTILNFADAKPLINEGDVLLFRGRGWASYFIGIAGESVYSHVAVASWHNGDQKHLGILECVEFREGSMLNGLFNGNSGGGGRTVTLLTQVNQYPEQIDVYRPTNTYTQYEFDAETKSTIVKSIAFNGKAVTNTMRRMTGLPYGWKRIMWLAKQKLAGFRLFYNRESLMNDRMGEIIYPICSTAVAYAFNSNNFDLINNKADEWTEPADIARSARLSYLFTLAP